MIAAYIQVLRKYAVFNGRANRSEYWWFVLMNLVIMAILFAISLTVHEAFIFVLAVYALGMFIPGLAVTVRRLHDSGKSAWWLLIYLVPFGGIVLIIFMLLGSDYENEYGPIHE